MSRENRLREASRKGLAAGSDNPCSYVILACVSVPTNHAWHRGHHVGKIICGVVRPCGIHRMSGDSTGSTIFTTDE